jgi:hypothetical protein
LLNVYNINFLNRKFEKIFIVEDRNYWTSCFNFCNKETDLVLCVDFALKKQLREENYFVEFLDHLVDSIQLEKLNLEMHYFLNNWYKDKNGQDTLEFKGYNLGDSLLLYIINDITFFCHYFFNIISLKSIQHEKVYLAVKDKTILSCIEYSGLNYSLLSQPIQSINPSYYFPIIKWVNEKIKPTLKFKLKNIFANIFDFYFKLIDSLFNKNIFAVYIQDYYPTFPIIKHLEINSYIQIILPNYKGLKNINKHRRIHYSTKIVSQTIAIQMFEKYKKERFVKWIVDDFLISDYLNLIIEPILSEHLFHTLNQAESTEINMKSFKPKLMIPITNLWTPNRLVMQYCFKNKIPVFTIINGQLNNSYYNDAKDSDYVNCYSISMKENYFENKSNALVLGDPRMDKYADIAPKKINRETPTIIIGTAGYDSIDLNSYLAYEFDFLYDILYCFTKLKTNNNQANIIIKVRANGYVDIYKDFIKEYFSQLNITIEQETPFFELIRIADLYISIFSQTLFEASCFGIPTIYYKKDTQFIHPPFDGKSELITAINLDDLEEKIDLFYNGSNIYDIFLQKSVMEKYIGPLDGRNTERNLTFINSILDNSIQNFKSIQN